MHPHVVIIPSEYSLIPLENNRGVNVPNKKAVSKTFMYYSKEPKFPTRMLFGLCLGLALGGGCEHFIGVRQSGALLAIQRVKSLNQGLYFILLQLKVQLHTVTQAKQGEV